MGTTQILTSDDMTGFFRCAFIFFGKHLRVMEKKAFSSSQKLKRVEINVFFSFQNVAFSAPPSPPLPSQVTVLPNKN